MELAYSVAQLGLNASGKRQTVIADNISNLETTAFKSKSAEFATTWNPGTRVEGVGTNFSGGAPKATELENRREAISTKQSEVVDLKTERDRLQAEIDTPAGIRIRRFLDERIGSGEYRNRLGVPAIVRRDLRRLTSYILEQNGKLRDSEQKRKLPPYEVNRIVLYVDDLDRCPPPEVVKVLEAAQLLVKTRLFVVVLAMDVRYVTRALEDAYEGILVVTYVVVLFSILVQGLTIAPVLRRLGLTGGAREAH